MSRTRTLLHYVLHNFKINPLSLVNRNFHVNGVYIGKDYVSFYNQNITITYWYHKKWALLVKDKDCEFAYETRSNVVVSYILQTPCAELDFDMLDEAITLYYAGTFCNCARGLLPNKVFTELKKYRHRWEN
jgi:hypothetical protein